MEFSTKVVEKMAEILAEEMEHLLPEPQDIREVESGMRELLQKVGAAGLKRYLEQVDEAEPQEKETDCVCQGKQRYLLRREAVILSKLRAALLCLPGMSPRGVSAVPALAPCAR